MDDITRRRIEKSQNNFDWNAADALEDVMDRVITAENFGKKIKLLAVWWEVDEDQGSYELHWSACKLSKLEHIALLEIHKMHVFKD